ncbi:hypothetical protein TEA_002892 [Camellia sinensis var. sinensis]|uniref:Uncharacterized protein n=1 Tax=Camellia sinensis var. sinensis TaxID=542762 RepID=A0A4S4DFB9_CAMSN|nr:hypothetical protein TEA_002892 [Camellia sinensis var. sinensis]
MLENDLDVLDMFYMQNVSRTINYYVDVVHSIGFEGGEVNDSGEDVVEIDHLVEDSDGNVEGDNEYHMDDFVGFSDEKKDWNENMDAKSESNSTSSEDVLSEDDGALSDYQSGDDAMVYDSGVEQVLEAEAWVHLREEADLLVDEWVLHLRDEATLHLREWALHLGEAEAKLHLEEVFQLR